MHCAFSRLVNDYSLRTVSQRLAYRGGVGSAITAPGGYGGVFQQGLSVALSLGSRHKLEKGAVLQEIAAVHVAISLAYGSSVSTQIAALRKLLLDPPKTEDEFGFQQASDVGLIPQAPP